MLIAICSAIILLGPASALAQTYLSTNFENFTIANWQGWSADQGIWQVGTPTGAGGPSAAHSGTKCAATDLAGGYPLNTDSRLVSPAVNLGFVSSGRSIQLGFWQWKDYAYGDAYHASSYGSVEIRTKSGSTWGPWSGVSRTINGSTTGWSYSSIDLTAFAGKQIQVAFHQFGGGHEAQGWFLDDISIAQVADMAFGLTVNFDNFSASSWAGWSADNGVWQVGNPTAGPASAHDGTQCACTGFVNNCPVSTDSYLSSPAVTLPTVSSGTSIVLGFWESLSFSYGDAYHAPSYGTVAVSVWSGTAWGAWQDVTATIVGTSDGWSYSAVDLTAFAGKRIQFAFHLVAGGFRNLGWFIDDVSLTTSGDQALNKTVTFEDFTSTNWQGWSTDNGIWQVATVGAFDGKQCAGTDVSGSYPTNSQSRLISRPFTLPAIPSGQSISLGFFQWFQYAAGDAYHSASYGDVEVSVWNGTAYGDWTQISTQYTGSSNWSFALLDLTPYAGKRLKVAFHHNGGGHSAAGWYLDDITIVLPNPIVKTLSPTTGPAGTTVIFSGSFLNSATAVSFHGVSQPNFSVNSTGTSLSTTVPAGATTGPVSVTTFAGTGVGPVFNVPAPPALASLKLAPSSLSPGMTTTGTVTLATTQSADVVVNLASDNAALSVPTTATVTAGNLTGTFTATANSVSSAASVHVTGTVGTSTASATASVAPWVQSVVATPTTVAAGGSSQLTVTLSNPAPASGLVVTLSSSNTAVASPTDSVKNPITSVTVPAGSTTQQINVATYATASNQSVTLTASNLGVSQTCTLNVTAGGAALTLFPTVVIGGGSSTGFVTLTAAAPAGGTTVNLTSSAPGTASVATQVKVSAGEETAWFPITTQAVAAQTKVTITATLGTASSTAILTVNPASVAPLGSMVIIPGTIVGGNNSIGLLTLAGPAPTSDVTITLTSSNSSLAMPDATVVIPAGYSSGLFDIHTFAVQKNTLVVITATLNGKKAVGTLTLTP